MLSALNPLQNPSLPRPSEESTSTEKTKIGILAPAVTHGWVAGVAYYAEQRCKELSDTVDYKLYTSNNAEEMTSQIDDLKSWGAEAIVAFPQWEGMEVPIQEAIDEGIVVVNFDIEIAADGVYRVSGDNESMGVEGAKYIVDKIGTHRQSRRSRRSDLRFRCRAPKEGLPRHHEGNCSGYGDC